MKLSWLTNAHFRVFLGIFTGKWVRLTWFLAWDYSSIASKSVYAILQVSVCSGYDLLHPGHTHTDKQHFDQLIRKAQPAVRGGRHGFESGGGQILPAKRAENFLTPHFLASGGQNIA